MYWNATQSVANNESTVLIDHWLDCASSYGLSIKAKTLLCTVGEDSKSIATPSISTNGNSSIKLGTTKHVVKHDSNGSKTVRVDGAFNMQATISGKYVSSITAGDDIVLENIPRKATITSYPTDWTDEDTPLIKYSNPAGNAVTSLQACVSIDGKNAYTSYYDLSKTGTEKSISWSAADITKLQDAVLNGSTSRTVTFFIKTVIGTETYHDPSKNTTLTIKNCKPTLSPTAKVTDAKTKALTGNDQTIVKNQSVVAVTTGAKALKRATIQNESIICGNSTLSSGSGNITNPQSSLFKFVASDNRGQTVSTEKLLGFVDYVNLSCSQSIRMSVDPALGDTGAIAKLTISGNYFNGTFGAVTNNLELWYRYKEVTNPETPWSTLELDGWRQVEETINKENDTYSTTVEIGNLYQDKQYVFQCRAIDAVYTNEGVTTREYSSNVKPVFDWGPNDFNFNVPVSFSSGILGVSPIGNWISAVLKSSSFA
jgi:hypothetical protein